MIVFTKTDTSFRCVTFFKPDRRDGTGFDADLVAIDSVYHRVGDRNNVTYASRDWSIRAHWLTSWMHKRD